MPSSPTPSIYLIARPAIDFTAVQTYLEQVGAPDWLETNDRQEAPSGEVLSEIVGRACYRSWEPGLNANVTQVRPSREKYLSNVIASLHGSVLEHANYTFVFSNVSRVCTHELVRHRPASVSQESGRFVRLTDLAVWQPQWAQDDPEVAARTAKHLADAEDLQHWFAEHFNLDDPDIDFHEKKERTSFMRRFAPEGIASTIVWTANVRLLRHVIEVRTAAGAEEEIRALFHKVALIMRDEVPLLFGDYSLEPIVGSDIPAWIPDSRKV